MESIRRAIDATKLEMCRRCFSVWFDAGEFLEMAKLSTLQTPKNYEAQKEIAKFQVEQIRIKEEMKSDYDPDLTTWQKIRAIFGYPVEANPRELRHAPIVTIVLTFVTTLLNIFFFLRFPSAAEYLGFIPTEPFRLFGLTTLTSFFVHGGWMHLIGNFYFLFVFGDDVEDTLGGTAYLALIFLGDIIGNVLVALLAPLPIPHIGASGGVFAVVVFYCFAFPKAKLVYFWALGIFTGNTFIRVPAWLGIGFMILVQMVGASWQLHGFSEVSYLSHLGGGIVGLFFWFFYRREIN